MVLVWTRSSTIVMTLMFTMKQMGKNNSCLCLMDKACWESESLPFRSGTCLSNLACTTTDFDIENIHGDIFLYAVEEKESRKK